MAWSCFALHGERDAAAVESYRLVLVVLFAGLNQRRAGGNARVPDRSLRSEPSCLRGFCAAAALETAVRHTNTAAGAALAAMRHN